MNKIEKKFEKLTYWEKMMLTSIIDEHIDTLKREACKYGYDPIHWKNRIKSIRVIQKKLKNSSLD